MCVCVCVCACVSETVTKRGHFSGSLVVTDAFLSLSFAPLSVFLLCLSPPGESEGHRTEVWEEAEVGVEGVGCGLIIFPAGQGAGRITQSARREVSPPYCATHTSTCLHNTLM